MNRNSSRRAFLLCLAGVAAAAFLGIPPASASGATLRLESPAMQAEVEATTGRWSLVDKVSGVRWPSEGSARPGAAKALEEGFDECSATGGKVRLGKKGGASVTFGNWSTTAVGWRFAMRGRTCPTSACWTMPWPSLPRRKAWWSYLVARACSFRPIAA